MKKEKGLRLGDWWNKGLVDNRLGGLKGQLVCCCIGWRLDESILLGHNVCLLILLCCIPRSTYWVELLEPHGILRSRGLWLVEDEVIIIVTVEVGIDLLHCNLILSNNIPHQLEVVVRVFEIGFILLDGFLVSLCHFCPYPDHLDPQGVPLPNSGI